MAAGCYLQQNDVSTGLLAAVAMFVGKDRRLQTLLLF